MKNRNLLICALAVIALGSLGCQKQTASGMNQKFVIILQADTDRHEGLARALHALLYAKELKENGADVALIFDGAGTGWAEKLQDPKHKLNSLFVSLQKEGAILTVCDFCSTAFKVKDKIKNSPVPLVSEYQGHPSLYKWIHQGYEIIVL